MWRYGPAAEVGKRNVVQRPPRKRLRVLGIKRQGRVVVGVGEEVAVGFDDENTMLSNAMEIPGLHPDCMRHIASTKKDSRLAAVSPFQATSTGGGS